MSRRASRRLYVGELVPDQRGRGQRAHSAKAMQEELRRMIAVELAAEKMITERLSRKAAIAKVAKQTHRNAAALDLLFKQNRDAAIKSVAARLRLTDQTGQSRERARELLDQGERRRSTRR